MKVQWESQVAYKMAGDTGYPISEVLVKPYSTEEAGQDRRKRLFNKRLSGLRTVMSENVFGIWKRRFPILRNMRTHLELTQKIIVATAILENIAIKLGEEVPNGEDDEQEEDDADAGYVLVDEAPNTVRLRGQISRDNLCNNMPV